ncbi:hypothetical protein ACLI1A_16125 [Flavobacterium sp. RHBU_3]|uniref:hypothetical protein n=1 Tax=Flavobacterium sp. RHBU_3 TaxID=3391184 RepID=UPI003985192A
MKSFNIISYVTIFIIFSLFACESKHKEQKGESLIGYMIILKNNKDYCNLVERDIELNIKSNKEKNIVVYDSLTKIYLNYLRNLESELKQHGSKIFYSQNGKISFKGKEFENRTKEYLESITRLSDNVSFRRKALVLINMNDLKMSDKKGEVAENNPDNLIVPDKIYFKYIDYYFKNLPNIQALTHISNREKSILELENEFILINK